MDRTSWLVRHLSFSAWLAHTSSQCECLRVAGFLTWQLASKREDMKAAHLLKGQVWNWISATSDIFCGLWQVIRPVQIQGGRERDAIFWCEGWRVHKGREGTDDDCLCWIFLNIYLFINLAGPGLSCGIWNLVPGPRIQSQPPSLEVWSLIHWTTREVPVVTSFGNYQRPAQASLHAY